MSVVAINSCFLKFKVTCVKCIENILYAGIGGNLLIFEAKNRSFALSEEIKNVLPNNIYGIQPDNSHKNIAIFGNKKLTVIPCFPCKWSNAYVWEAKQWILCVQWLTDECLAIVTGLNEVELINWTNKTVDKKAVCEEKCILYSAHLVGSKWDNLVLLAGTVYTEILVWAPSFANKSCPSVIHRLKGHNGVIFSVDYHNATRRICSTSDDRTVRIWNVINRQACNLDCSELNLEQWTESSIEPFVTIFGHSARVWRGRLTTDGRIISIGEDSLLCIWDKNGKNLLKQETHQGGRLCCLEVIEEDGLAITGGSDGGINVWSIHKNVDELSSTVLSCRDPGRLLVLDSGSVVVVYRTGFLFECQKNCQVFQDERFVNYCLCEASPCGKLIAFGCIEGDVLILEDKIESENRLQLIAEKKVFDGKIFSLQWLQPNFILCCGIEGQLSVIKLEQKDDDSYLDPIEHLTLPSSRERWVTCAVLHYPTLICGTRNGSIHVYQLGYLDNKDPLQSFHKIHGRLGVTSLLCSGQHLLSTGRDGTLRRFTIDKTSNLIDQEFVDKLPFSWAAKVIETDLAGNLVIGFHEKDLVVWSQRSRVVVWKFNCCGGHREWKCFLKANLLHLYFMKDKTIHSVKKPLELIASTSLLDGFHTRELNTLKLLGISESISIVVSGGEDNTARVGFLSSSGKLLPSVVLTGHLSSVRAIALLPLQQKQKIVLFTAGGRAQLKAWLLHYYINREGEPTLTKSVELGSHMINDELDSKRPLKNVSPRLDPETRYMDISVLQNCDSNERFTVYSACSDGYLRIFDFSLEDNKFRLNSSIPHQRCLLKAGHLKYKGNIFAITSTTNGFISVWNTSDKKRILHYQAFGSGVNSCDIFRITDHEYLIASGGDNCRVSICLINLFDVDCPTITCLWSSSGLHFSQVSGVKLEENVLFTIGVDQRLNVLRWKMCDRNVLEVNHLRQYCSYIPDVHGLAVIRLSKNSYTVCIYGVGIEILQVTLDSCSKTVSEKSCSNKN